MNDPVQNAFDFLALVVGFMVLLLVCGAVAKTVLYARGWVIVQRQTLRRWSEVDREAAKSLKAMRAMIDELAAQHRRGHLIFNCHCDDCKRLADIMEKLT